MVAMICPEKQGDNLSRLFHNQYVNADGKWVTDFDHKATCRQDKVEILEYCRKVSQLHKEKILRPAEYYSARK